MHSKRNFSMIINRGKGFTLIELMIVVAIIGILSAIAIPAYQGHMVTTRMTKCSDNFMAARKYVAERFELDKSRRDNGVPWAVANIPRGDMPLLLPALVLLMNEGGTGTAPEGGLAPYVAGAGVAATCQIGLTITVAGGTWSTGAGDNIVVTRPAYMDFPVPVPVTIFY